jgi:hypothetical protein
VSTEPWTGGGVARFDVSAARVPDVASARRRRVAPLLRAEHVDVARLVDMQQLADRVERHDRLVAAVDHEAAAHGDFAATQATQRRVVAQRRRFDVAAIIAATEGVALHRLRLRLWLVGSQGRETSPWR